MIIDQKDKTFKNPGRGDIIPIDYNSSDLFIFHPFRI